MTWRLCHTSKAIVVQIKPEQTEKSPSQEHKTKDTKTQMTKWAIHTSTPKKKQKKIQKTRSPVGLIGSQPRSIIERCDALLVNRQQRLEFVHVGWQRLQLHASLHELERPRPRRQRLDSSPRTIICMVYEWMYYTLACTNSSSAFAASWCRLQGGGIYLQFVTVRGTAVCAGIYEYI